LITASGECPAKAYVALSGATEPDADTVRWALERYQAFLAKSETFDLRCESHSMPQDICSNPNKLSGWLKHKVVETASVGESGVWLKLGRTTDVRISLKEPGSLDIFIHPPTPF